MEKVGVTEEDAGNKVAWMWMICHGDSEWKQTKEEESSKPVLK